MCPGIENNQFFEVFFFKNIILCQRTIYKILNIAFKLQDRTIYKSYAPLKALAGRGEEEKRKRDREHIKLNVQKKIRLSHARGKMLEKPGKVDHLRIPC